MLARILIFTFVSILPFATRIHAQGSDANAIAYNDRIVEAQNRIGLILLKFNQAIAVHPEDTVRAIHSEAVEVIKANLDSLDEMGSYERNDSMRLAAISLFQFYMHTVVVDYEEMLHLLFLGPVNEERMSQMEDIIARVAYEEAQVDKIFQDAQKNFADRYGFTLGENRVQQEINSQDNE